MRCGTFNDQLSADIFRAFEDSMTKYRMVCQKENGQVCRNGLQFRDRAGLERLAAALNKRFSDRIYTVETVRIYEIPVMRRAA